MVGTMQANPEVTVNLDLSDRIVDIVNRRHRLRDSHRRTRRFVDGERASGEMRRMVVASPAYLVEHGVPKPADLAGTAAFARPAARLAVPGDPASWGNRHLEGERSLRVQRRCRAARSGRWPVAAGLALAGEVGSISRKGRWCRCSTRIRRRRSASMPCFRSRRHLPLRVRLFIDLLKETYGQAGILGTDMGAAVKPGKE